MALGYAATLRNAQLDEITAAIDAGAGPGLLRIYDGARPATGGTATNLLAELTFSDPSAAAAAAGVLTANAISDDLAADDTGTATWFRVVDSDAAFVMDGSVGTSDADMILNSTSITAGGTVAITSFVITSGNA